jgi:hypothetical protein
VTRSEMKSIRHGLSEAIGRRLSLADMAKLCGLKDPGGSGRLTYREWEEGNGPSGPVAVLLSLYLAGLNYDDSCEHVEDPATFMLNDIRRRLYG